MIFMVAARDFGLRRLVGRLKGSALILLASWVALAVVTGFLVRGELRGDERLVGVRVTSDVVYRDEGGRRERLDVYEPEGVAPPGGRPALLALHGGGWRGGSKRDYGRSLAALARSGVVVVAADYRLSGDDSPSWPENIEDVREAVRWLHKHASEYQVDRSRVGVIGASAGGHLALLLGMEKDHLRDDERVSAVIDFYGPTDLGALFAGSGSANLSARLMTGGSPTDRARTYDEASPLKHVSEGVAPVLIFHGGDDWLMPLEQSRRLERAMGEANVRCRLVVVDGARHGFGLRVGERDLVPEILQFLEEVWARVPERLGR